MSTAVPLVLQSDVGDCGAACVRMLARDPDVAVEGPPVRRPASRLRSVASLADLLAIAAGAGVPLRAVRLPGPDAVETLPLPAICRLDGNHYVVVTGRRLRTLGLADPMQGRLRLTREDFATRWDAVAAVPRSAPPVVRWPARIRSRAAELAVVPQLLGPAIAAPVACCAAGGALTAIASTGLPGGVASPATVPALVVATGIAALLGRWSERAARHALSVVRTPADAVPGRVRALRDVRERSADLALRTAARHLLLAAGAVGAALTVVVVVSQTAGATTVVPVAAGVLGALTLRAVDAASRAGERCAHVWDAELGAVVQAGSVHRGHPDVLAFTVRRALVLHARAARTVERNLPAAGTRTLGLVLTVALVVFGPVVIAPGLGAGAGVLALLVLAASWWLAVVAHQADAVTAARQFRDHWSPDLLTPR